MKETELFFVYGTLKEAGYFAEAFDQFRVNSQKASIDGFAIYDLGSFPAIAKKEGCTVNGELHEYTDPEAVTMMMDNIEGYNEARDVGLYLRRRLTVGLEDGTEVEANAYVFGSEIPEGAHEIKNGTWD